MKRFLVLPLMFFSLLSCSFAKMPKLPLVEVYYSHGSQMNRFPQFCMTIRCEGDSVCAICFDQERMGYVKYRINESGIMDTLRSVIEDNKMYQYKDHYNNKHVLDGSSWGFHARFSDNAEPAPNKAYLSSGGSNAGPRNNKGRSILESKMKAALKSAELLYSCNEEGEEVPNVPIEVRSGDDSAVDFIYLIHNEYYGRLDFRFHDTDKSEMFRALLGDLQIESSCKSLKTRAERSYGSKIVVADPKCPVLYLIVDQGAVEAVDLVDLVKEQPHTTRFSVTRGLTDIQLIDGVAKGIDANGNAVDIEWETVAE